MLSGPRPPLLWMLTTPPVWSTRIRDRCSPLACTRTALRAQVCTTMSPEWVLSSRRCPRCTVKVVSMSGASAVAARARASSTGGLLSAPGRDDGRGLTKQVDLAAHGPGEVGVEVRIVGVGRERPAGLRDGPVDEREVALENVHGGRIEDSPALLEHLLQLG